MNGTLPGCGDSSQGWVVKPYEWGIWTMGWGITLVDGGQEEEHVGKNWG